jgi:hypothetical protein
MWRLALFVTMTLAFWLAVVVPVRVWGGEDTAVAATVAAAVCLVPAALTLLWSDWARRQSPDALFVAWFGGTGVRLLLVGVAAMALHQRVEYLRQDSANFLLWVVVFYLFTLAAEVGLLVTSKPAPTPPAKADVAAE